MFPIFQDPTAVETLICNIVQHVNATYAEKIDAVVGKCYKDNEKGRGIGILNVSFYVGLDARGFLFGPLVALRLGAAFVPVRKQGKLPGDCAQAVYKKEYGEVTY